MSQDEALELMEAVLVLDAGDTESIHGKFDHILCELLRRNGFEKAADKFESIERWYS